MFAFWIIPVLFVSVSALSMSDNYKKTEEIESKIAMNLTSLSVIECGQR